MSNGPFDKIIDKLANGEPVTMEVMGDTTYEDDRCYGGYRDQDGTWVEFDEKTT